MFKLSNETKLGILFIVAISAAVWGFKFLKGINLFSSNKIFYVEYTNVDKLLPSSPVFINGLQVGIVKDIYLDDKDDNTIITELNIEGDVDIPKNTIAKIVGMSVMGGKVIELYIPQPCEGPDCAQSGDYIIGESLPFLQSIIGPPGQLDEYTEKLKLGLTSVYDSIADPNNPQGLGKALVAMQQSLTNLSAMTYKINRLLDASTNSFTATAKNAEMITAALASNQANLTATIDNVKAVTDQLKASNIDQQADKAGIALDSMTASLGELRSTLQQMQGTVGVTTDLVNKINSGEGTAGKMLTDAQFYENMLNTTAHLELLLQDIRLNPKRYNTVKLKWFGNKRGKYEDPALDPAYDIYRDSVKLLRQ